VNIKEFNVACVEELRQMRNGLTPEVSKNSVALEIARLCGIFHHPGPVFLHLIR
jgi:hypothetical protein